MKYAKHIAVAVRAVAITAPIVFNASSPARSDELTADDVARLKDLLQPKFLVAQVLEAASFAAEKCPGFHIIEDNIEAEYHSAGASDSDMYTPEFELMSARGKANAAEGYAKNPTRTVRKHVALPRPCPSPNDQAHPSLQGLTRHRFEIGLKAKK